MIRHLTFGLRILGERWSKGLRRWLGAGENWADTGVRWLLVGGTGYGAAHLLLSTLWAVGAVALIVCVLALRAATKAVMEQPKAPAEPASGPADDLTGEQLLAAIWGVLGGAPAVHLTTLAQRLTDLTGQSWDPDRVRQACRAAAIPIRPKVRDLGGDRVSSGVHRDDLEPLPQPLSEGATPPVGAATSQVTPATPGGNATALQPVTRRLGDLRITSIPDADNPHRTHVKVLDPTRRKGA